MSRIFCVYALIFGCCCLNAQEVKFSKMSIDKPNHVALAMEGTVDGKKVMMPMAIFLPKDYNENGKRKYPTILFLHGIGERGVDLVNNFLHGPGSEVSKNVAMRENFPFIILTPQITVEWTTNTFTTLKLMLDEAIKRYHIDVDNIMVTGLSMGGLGTWQALVDLNDYVSSASPMSARDTRFPYETAKKTKYQAVWTMVGGNDASVFLNGTKKMYAAMRALGVDTQMTIVPNVEHFVWMFYYNNPQFYHWVIHQRRPTVTMAKQSDAFLALKTDKNVLYAEERAFLPTRSSNQGLIPGWQAQWFKDKELKTSLLTRTEPKIYYPEGRFNLPEELKENISARYTAYLKITKREFYHFYTTANDGVRFYVDKNKIIDDWNEHDTAWLSGSAYLDVGYHTIEVEYFQAKGGMNLIVEWGISGAEKKILEEVESEPLNK